MHRELDGLGCQPGLAIYQPCDFCRGLVSSLETRVGEALLSWCVHGEEHCPACGPDHVKVVPILVCKEGGCVSGDCNL